VRLGVRNLDARRRIDRVEGRCLGDPQRDAIEQVIAAERHDERGDAEPGDESAVEQADQRADADRERQRGVDRNAQQYPHHGERIGAEAVHRAEREIDLAYHDDERQSERHDRDRAHRAKHRYADIYVERVGLEHQHQKRHQDDGEEQAPHTQREVEGRLTGGG
jgi:hypothetical protein